MLPRVMGKDRGGGGWVMWGIGDIRAGKTCQAHLCTHVSPKVDVVTLHVDSRLGQSPKEIFFTAVPKSVLIYS